MKALMVALAGACLISTGVGAQMVATPAPVATPPIVAPVSNAAMLRAGTTVSLRMAEELTTRGKKLKPGYRFQMQTADAVMVSGVTVIPVGSPAVGEVTDVRNKGMWGKSGRISARVLFVRVNGRQIAMTGQFDDKGTTGTAGVVGAVALLPVAGFFVTGTSATIPNGAGVSGFINEDVPVTFAASTAAPLVVAAQVRTEPAR